MIEIMIVVAILAIIAMIVIPQWAKASSDARESRIGCDLQTVRKQISLYQMQHAGRSPDLDENGSADTANFVARLLGQTNSMGKLNGGALGPYLTEWPTNGFADSDVAGAVKFGTATAPPRDASTGWYYSTLSSTFSANSTQGGSQEIGVARARPWRGEGILPSRLAGVPPAFFFFFFFFFFCCCSSFPLISEEEEER